MNKTTQFAQLEQNIELLKKLKNKYQQQYIRKRLNAIEFLWQGESRPEVCKLVRCSYQILDNWLDTMINLGTDKGLAQLATPITKTFTWRLPDEKKEKFKQVVLTQSPQDYGMEDLVWTGKTLVQFLSQEWQVRYKPRRVYDILSELNLSHQRAHRDYADADPRQQRKYGKRLKKTT